MSELIADKNKPWLDVLFETLIDNNGAVPALYYHHIESDMRATMKAPFVSFGSDGWRSGQTTRRTRDFLIRVHSERCKCNGAVRSGREGAHNEEAVRKASSQNAAKVRLYDRGLLRPGMWADVVIFNGDDRRQGYV